MKPSKKTPTSPALFKKPGVYLTLDIGNSIELTVLHKDSKITKVKTSLDRLVVDFIEAVSVSNKPYYLKDFCTDNFFKRKAGVSALALYKETQEGSVGGAETFVEFGANMGALLANLDILFQPKHIVITGNLSKTFDAWSHAMGKTRNEHLGKKATAYVSVI